VLSRILRPGRAPVFAGPASVFFARRPLRRPGCGPTGSDRPTAWRVPVRRKGSGPGPRPAGLEHRPFILGTTLDPPAPPRLDDALLGETPLPSSGTLRSWRPGSGGTRAFRRCAHPEAHAPSPRPFSGIALSAGSPSQRDRSPRVTAPVRRAPIRERGVNLDPHPRISGRAAGPGATIFRMPPSTPGARSAGRSTHAHLHTDRPSDP